MDFPKSVFLDLATPTAIDFSNRRGDGQAGPSLLDGLSEPQKRRFAAIICEHIEAARAAADEFTSS